jgi:vacuolar-type H+-ATPase subunit F/Vma7
MDGFKLLGMETYPDATPRDVELLLKELMRQNQRAVVYLQHDLSQADIPVLTRLRNEGGDILISEIPDIHSAEGYEAPVDKLIGRVLGANALREVTGV